MNESVYDHSLRVSFDSYRIAKRLGLNYEACAIGGLLHDFYDKPWQSNVSNNKFFQKHGFVHAAQARMNAKKTFPHLMNPLIEDIIMKHMFPLNIIPPRYLESWLVTLVDKVDSIDFLFHPKIFYSLVLKRKKSRK